MTMRPDPTFHASPRLAMEAPLRILPILCCSARAPRNLTFCSDRREAGLADVQPVVHTVTDALYKVTSFTILGGAASPLVCRRSPVMRSSSGATWIIPGILRHLRRGHETSSHRGQDPQDHRARGGPQETGDAAASHSPLRTWKGFYVSTLGGGGKDGTEGPPGIFIMDCEDVRHSRPLGRTLHRGPQKLQYDFWWNLPRRDQTCSPSEWGLPPQYENGVVLEDLLSNKYDRLHCWDLRARRHVQTLDPAGANHQMALEVLAGA